MRKLLSIPSRRIELFDNVQAISQLHKRCLASQREAVRVKDSSDKEAAEWEAAKPFEQIPGHKSFPIVGSSWVLFPIVGK